MLPPKGTIKNLGHASRGRRPKSAGAIKARTKAAKMAERQAQAEHRERLRKLLTQKLTAKHGPGKKQAIRANVDQFVKSNTAVNELELKKLDKLVEDKNTIDKVWPSAREVKPAAGSAVQVIKQKESLSRSETPELTQEIDRHSKWKVLNAYSALQNEDFEASFVQKERAKKKEYRKILDEQMVIKQSKCDLGVPRCCGAFTPSTRLVSRNDGSGWFLFRCRGHSDRVERPRCSAQVPGS